MTDERRYSDDEIAEIFQAAASEPDPRGGALTPVGGLELGELQAIGARVGIAPERVAEAAAAVELRRGRGPRRTHLGLPVTVGRTVALPRAPTDREWEMLVAELRETFGAHGRDASQGGVRAWRNGKLHAYVEPTPAGYRLRLGTTKTNAAVFGTLGAAGLGTGLLQLALPLMGSGGGAAEIAITMTALGSAALAANALRLPGWASEREAQMDRVAASARSLLRADEPA